MLLTRRSLLRDCENVANLCFQLYCSPTPGSWASVCANLVKWYRQHSAAARRRAICQLRALSRALPRRAGTRAKNAPKQRMRLNFLRWWAGGGCQLASAGYLTKWHKNPLSSFRKVSQWMKLHTALTAGPGLCNNVWFLYHNKRPIQSILIQTSMQ